MIVFCRAARAIADIQHGWSWRMLLEDESGQDLVEYALAASFIGVAGYLVLTTLGGDIFETYDSWRVAVPSVWEPAAPSGGS